MTHAGWKMACKQTEALSQAPLNFDDGPSTFCFPSKYQSLIYPAPCTQGLITHVLCAAASRSARSGVLRCFPSSLESTPRGLLAYITAQTVWGRAQRLGVV